MPILDERLGLQRTFISDRLITMGSLGISLR